MSTNDTKKPREFWITRHPDSGDKDKATHIALHHYDKSKNPIHVIEKSYADSLEKHRDLLLNSNSDLSIEAGNYRVEISELKAQCEKLAAALKNTTETIHDEFCGGSRHHGLCETPISILAEYEEWKKK